MRLIQLGLILLIGGSAAPHTTLVAQTTDTTVKMVKKPSKLGAITKRLADTAATTVAGMGVQSLLGKKAGGVASALGLGGLNPCGAGATAHAGAAIVGVAKGIVKQSTDSTPAATAVPCPQMAGMAALAGGPGAAAASAAAAAQAAAMAQAAAQGANPMSGMGVMAAMTPVGMAVAAAPLAGKAAKGIKGMFGGKPQDKIAMLRELGKGHLELKNVKFIEGTAELEAGFEPSFAALGEAIQLAEGTYILHVEAEAGEKNVPRDTALARKRMDKVWAALLANGVSDRRIIPVSVLPPEMQQGRKPPKRGQAHVEIILMQEQP